MSKALPLLHRHAFAAVALLLLTAGGAYGVAGQGGGQDKSQAARIYACVQAKTHLMKKTTATRSCPKGSKKISWRTVGRTGATGPAGVAGKPGAVGPMGLTGPAGADAVSAYAEFFALAPPDNATTVAPGAAVSFPQDGPSSGTITRFGSSAINLPDRGTYRVSFSVPVNEAGQLVMALNGIDLTYTVVGRATGTSVITGVSLVQTTLAGSALTVENPAESSTALTITPFAGGTRPVAATLIIERLD